MLSHPYIEEEGARKRRAWIAGWMEFRPGAGACRFLCPAGRRNHTIPPSLTRAENWCGNDTESRRGLRSRVREGFCVRQDGKT
jgi:hypothetical protein